MMMRIPQRVPTARIEGVYLESMVGRGREIILGMTRDPQFGPMLMFGLGGIFVEVMKDVTFHIAPITKEESLQMLRSTKSFALLKGVRGQASVDLDAIAEALQRISQLVTDFPRSSRWTSTPSSWARWAASRSPPTPASRSRNPRLEAWQRCD